MDFLRTPSALLQRIGDTQRPQRAIQMLLRLLLTTKFSLQPVRQNPETSQGIRRKRSAEKYFPERMFHESVALPVSHAGCAFLVTG